MGLHFGSKKDINFEINLRKLSIFLEPKWSFRLGTSPFLLEPPPNTTVQIVSHPLSN